MQRSTMASTRPQVAGRAAPSVPSLHAQFRGVPVNCLKKTGRLGRNSCIVRAETVVAPPKPIALIPGTVGEAINAIRFLAIDGVNKANSGHPGLPMGCAPMAYVLFNEYMNFNPKDPFWFNRDRFVLSAGHGSMLQYALLHLTGYEGMTVRSLTVKVSSVSLKIGVSSWNSERLYMRPCSFQRRSISV